MPLFPDAFQPILDFLPFRGLADTPFRLYMGHIPASQVWSVERPDPLGSGPLFQWLAPVVGLLFFAVCLRIWQVGVRHYRSTGS
ncbi:MAG: ABC-2 family transporter protein [Gemmatimonadetes bacterium]|nr:ABC-2 family transporter protein [Gemmatimonadota bacterium]MDE2736792.1 ABC-2 family transporter protein [Gemmatimonadota bacterium]